MDTTLVPHLAELTNAQIREHRALDYCKWLGCLAETNLPLSASRSFLQRWPRAVGAGDIKMALETKAAVLPGTTTDGTWAAPLVGVQPLKAAFIAVARSASLLGRIPGLRQIPFNVKVPFETSGAIYKWVKEGAPKPASAMAFSHGITLAMLKGAGIPIVTRELIELTVTGMEGALRDDLVGGLTAWTDKSFLDPAVAAIPGEQPASVTNGTTPIASTGNYATDVQTLLMALGAARPDAQGAVLIADFGHAVQLHVMNNGGGPGVPVIVSGAAQGNTIAMDPTGVFVADNGVEIDISREASMQMSDAPDSPVTASTVHVSLWQQNLVGFRVERFVNWQAVPGAVKYLAA